MKNDFLYPPIDKTAAKEPSNRFSYKEYLRGTEDLENLRRRAIRGLYNAAVTDGRYPVAKPTLHLHSDPFSFNGTYVLAEVETL